MRNSRVVSRKSTMRFKHRRRVGKKRTTRNWRRGNLGGYANPKSVYVQGFKHIESLLVDGWFGASGLYSIRTKATAFNINPLVFRVHGMPVGYFAPAGSPVAVGHNPELVTPQLEDLRLTWTSPAAFSPASSTSSWFALPFSMAFVKSWRLESWIWTSSPRGPASSNALLVTRLIASTLMSQCRATMISGTVDIPTTSAPKFRNKRHSALVS